MNIDISNNKKIISLFSGSRSSEVNLLLPILIDFINMMNKKFDNFSFVFHATDENKSLINEKINNSIDESAYLLGYSKVKTFSKIHIPHLRTNIILVMLLISLEVIKELPITLILRPFNFETFATQAYIYASQDLLEAAAIPSLFLIFWSTILILLSSRYILSAKN